MSRERNLERLKASLLDTKNVLADLIAGTAEDASKRLNKANKQLKRNYSSASSNLNAAWKDTAKDAQKQYASTAKDVQKQYAGTRKDLEKQYYATRKDLEKQGAVVKDQLNQRVADGRAAAMAAGQDLKLRTSTLLEGLAGGVLAARNKLTPDNRLTLTKESDARNITKAGYFVRFAALAIIIISKRHKLMALATQLYNKLKDSEGRNSLTNDAREQFDTMRRLIKAYANGQYREFPYKSLVKIVAAVVYFVSVADLIPDFIPVLGITDDLAILAWVYSSVKDDLQQFVDWEAAEEKRRSRLAQQTTGSKQSSSEKSESSSTATAGSTSGVANVGNAAAPDRSPSPAVTTNTGESGSKATVTTGTSGSSTAGTSGSSTGSGATGSSTGSAGSQSGGSSSPSGTSGNSNSGNRPGAGSNQA